jgi:hypothetical protein
MFIQSFQAAWRVFYAALIVVPALAMPVYAQDAETPGMERNGTESAGQDETKPEKDDKTEKKEGAGTLGEDAEKAARAEDDAVPIRASAVSAVYRINWLGTHIGDFVFRSSIANRQYALQATADVSVFFGTVTWKGVTTSRGVMTSNGPLPSAYNFRYVANDKGEAIALRFAQNMVRDISVNPPYRTGGRRVPITSAHLQNVVDPLSAVILLSQSRIGQKEHAPCTRRLPVFDGKMRYDLVLFPKGTRSIGKQGIMRGTAHVCGVRYVPIAGHKPGKQGDEDYMTGNTGMEVWLVPLPDAGLVAPYYISVPTPAGAASLVSAKFDVQMGGTRRALVN